MTASLSVLQVSPTDVGGGAEAIALRLHLEYLRRGHHATLCVGRRRGDDPGVAVLHHGGGPAWRLWRRLDGARRFRLARLARALAEPGTVGDVMRGREDFRFPGARSLLDASPALPDVVHLHNLHGGYFDLRVLPDFSARVPVVATLHDAWLLTGHCAHPFECERWQAACGSCPHLDTYPALRRDGTAFNLARKRELYGRSRLTVVTPSAWLMRMVERSALAAAASRTAVIPDGVDLSLFRPGDRAEARNALGVAPEATVLLFTAHGGRASTFRDFAVLERALARLGRVAALEVVVLGDESPARRGPAPVRSPGRVAPAEVARWLNAADVYVHPSRADTFPGSVLESLACGVPVVASRVGGIPEQLTERTGVLVEPGDPEALAAAIGAMLADRDRRARMGAAAAADARARFSLELQVETYLALYEELAG